MRAVCELVNSLYSRRTSNQTHGRTLYTSLMDRFIRDTRVGDVTVEDPNDGFQDMRDRCDVQRLLENNALAGLCAPLDNDMYQNTSERV
ncbi:histone acetyltransferase type B catalytic subunit [Batrachochytrium salamandrivorans]|nr:histone acetyltransferase type B catalytic subunit [Batrachochytrium salamandrivorans]